MEATCAQRVSAFLRCGPASFSEIIKYLGVDDETLRLCLGIMLRAGQIVRDEAGEILYMLPGEARRRTAAE